MRGLSTLSYVALFLFYWLQYSIIIFFNTALVEVAMKRFDGQDASIGDGLRRATTLLPVILIYAAIAASVGTCCASSPSALASSAGLSSA